MFDVLCRLQVLEGAFGVPVGTWSKEPHRGLSAVRAFLRDGDRAPKLHPLWVVAGDSGLYKAARHIVSRILSEADTDDVMQRVLSGLGAKAEKAAFLFWEAGKADAKAVCRGMNPTNFAAHNLTWFLRRKATDVVKSHRRDVPYDPGTDNTAYVEVPVPVYERLWDVANRAKVFAALDADTRRTHRYFRYLMDTFYVTGDTPKHTEIAAHFGVGKVQVGSGIKESLIYLAPFMPSW